MGVFQKMFGYIVKLKCSNCGFLNDTKVPKGTPVEDFIKTGSFKCFNCGCITQPTEYQTKWLK